MPTFHVAQICIHRNAETSGYEAHLHETDDNDSEDDDRQLVELLVNRLSRKKVSGNRPASKTLRATMLSADIYRQLSATVYSGDVESKIQLVVP